MLDKFREGAQGPAAKIILIVVILSFALAGVGGYLGSTTEQAAVTVNGEDISRQDVETAYQNERSQMENQYGDAFANIAADPNFSQQLRSNVLQRLVSERLTDQAIDELGLRVSDEQIKQAIRQMPEFQRDGQFDNQTYLAVLSRASYSPEQFRDYLRQDMSRRQLLNSYIASEFSLPVETEQLLKLQTQERTIRQLTIPADKFAADVKVTDEEVQNYFDMNPMQFQNPEQVKLEFVLIDVATLAQDITLSDDEISKYYNEHQKSYKADEKRLVAHILVDGSKENAEQQAYALLEKLNQGEDFAALAKSDSDDTFSGENGGELDWFVKGDNDPAFDDAAFALTAAGDLSGVVKSEFGYHIIKLIDVQADAVAPLAEVKDKIATTLKRDKAMAVFYEKQQQVSELAFEVPDTLSEAADAAGLEVATTEFFSQASAVGEIANPLVLNQAFSIDFREEGLNSELVELSPEQSIVFRVTDYKAQSAKELAEVKDQIVAQLSQEKAGQAAADFAKKLSNDLSAGKDITADIETLALSFKPEETISRINPGFNQTVANTVFAMAKPAAGAMSYETVEQMNGDIVLVELSQVADVNNSAESTKEVDQLSQFIQRAQADGSYQALIKLLQDKAEITYPTAE
ncbi:peptidylprolyl isomerase [Motilimonas pumila]|uniref:Periplasmic chaperone PpiD n=1 Tax=Motilimonas pumila TaxID=2303987 RepID=A0A418YCI3_9GAMM|nr:peptidylprolyl isomerase [Motilimonas pumila]RJG42172.1 peptidylprolyl isomerase [Motilimonas pumila]